MGTGQLLNTNRDWEDGYRQRWQHDKIVRSTHGVNPHRLMQLEDLCQKRSGNLGNAAVLTTRAPARTRRTTNHAVARAAPATPGTRTALTA
ncbi:hypothetical protein MJ588_17415 [Klebsiella pneumoniae]|nr:hypothetical protein MJ588_17415 [Klebsiella pneumoniae]